MIMPYFLFRFLYFLSSPGRWLRNIKIFPSFLDLSILYPNWIYAVWLLFRNDYKVNFVIAQQQLEGGSSLLSTKYNNLFGITYAASKYNVGSILMKDTLSNKMMYFAVYKNPVQCVYDYYYYVNKTNKWCGRFLNNVPQIQFISDGEITHTYYRNTAYGYKYYGHYYSASAVDYGNSIVSLSGGNRDWRKGFKFINYSSVVLWCFIGWFIKFIYNKLIQTNKRVQKEGAIRKGTKNLYNAAKNRGKRLFK
jgi:hypothetical protein